MSTDVALLHQSLGKEARQHAGEGGLRFHATPSHRRSSRSLAAPSKDGQAERYQ
jgi:hypothetical protein